MSARMPAFFILCKTCTNPTPPNSLSPKRSDLKARQCDLIPHSHFLNLTPVWQTILFLKKFL